MRRGTRGMTRGRGGNKLAPDVPAVKTCTLLRSDPTRVAFIRTLVPVQLSLKKHRHRVAVWTCTPLGFRVTY